MHSTLLVQALATISFASSATAHMIMANPVPYSKDKVDNGPLSGAADYPCKQQLGFDVSQENEMKVGEPQTLSFTGSAVHGGGSCQLSITTDRKPTAASVFKVIKSLEGGCPGDENGPKTFDFTLPPDTPNGQLTFAWTWNSLLAGQPELYMNCAPITVTGGKDDTSGLDALPDMLPVNLKTDGGIGCKAVEGAIVQYPNPGEDLVTNFGSRKGAAPEGAACAQAAPGAGAGGAGQQSAAAPVVTSAPSPVVSTPAAVIPAPQTSAPAASRLPPPNTGGQMFQNGSSQAPVAALPTSTLTTMVTVTAPLEKPTPSANPVSSPDTPSPGVANGGGAGTSCTSDGQIVCNGSDKFGLCNHGSVVWQSVASGTTCAGGAIVKKRSGIARKLRFHRI